MVPHARPVGENEIGSCRGLNVELREDAWLAGLFGHPVFRVEPGAGGGPASDGRGPAFYYTKVNTDRVDLVRALGEAGFYVVDVNVTFGIETCSLAAGAAARTSDVHEVSADERDAVLDIAGSCFRFSRFHLDPAVPIVLADRIKREWIRSYVQGRRGCGLFTTLRDSKPAGFLAVLASESGGRRVRTIDLIGVAPVFQRRGVGRELVEYFIDHYRGECDLLTVGTQAANLPSLRLYETAGFSVIGTQYVLHRRLPGPGGRLG